MRNRVGGLLQQCGIDGSTPPPADFACRACDRGGGVGSARWWSAFAGFWERRQGPCGRRVQVGGVEATRHGRSTATGCGGSRSGCAQRCDGALNFRETLAFTEIRLYGASSPFVAREMRLALASLGRQAPAARQSAIERQIGLLEHAVRESGSEPAPADVAAVDASARPDGAAGGTAPDREHRPPPGESGRSQTPPLGHPRYFPW